ncbi:hypothetical protein HUJ05_007911 [Dendroctonus ponderosae]|nr:hypothetical protein HUJ05_007911 [Dendroctonus ponderosae]
MNSFVDSSTTGLMKACLKSFKVLCQALSEAIWQNAKAELKTEQLVGDPNIRDKGTKLTIQRG